MSALDSLAKSLSDSVKRLLRLPMVDEAAIKELVKDLQRALLQADVNVNLVLEISKRVEERSIKESLPPGISRREHVVKVLYEELTRFLGEEPAKTTLQEGTTNIVMLVGIQGTGKTTGAIKIARYYQKRGLRAGVVCADVYRPGAFEQLKQMADRVGVSVYGDPGEKNPERIVRDGVDKLRKEKFDIILIDTAGRHKDEKALMEEMKRLSEVIKPDEILLAIDGTIGQQAMAHAKAFNDTTTIGSIYVTKLDGSAKGGGALSAVAATGAKIKFVGTGEKIEDIEQFIPSNFVGRLLGMGDLQALLDRVKDAELNIPEAKVKAFMQGRFTLTDLYHQMEGLRRMGPLRKVWKMMPGGVNIPDDQIEVAEKKLDDWRIIIQSMRKDEVEDPKMIDSSRAHRIARGSGKSERDVKELVNQYFMMKKMVKSLKRRQLTLGKRMPFAAQ
jgi:signal recognition particle subunit SRP54